MQIGIVNDSTECITALLSIIKKEPAFEAIWVAHNGKQALNLCHRHRPDLILMDIDMPLMNGVEATERIMREAPCAILIVTANPTKETQQVFEAMGHGALDVVALTLNADGCSQKEEQDLLKKIGTIGRLKGKIHPLKVLGENEKGRQMKRFPPLLAVGASTGGPIALARILSELPKEFPMGIIVVQHLDEKFTGGLAKWLQGQTGRQVSIVRHGEPPASGKIMLAGMNQHLIMNEKGQLRYTPLPRDCSYCPSVDVFFESLAANWPRRSIGLLLTGMGNDGAKGLKTLRDKGWHTIAEHESSCVIYGMPRAAIECGGATEVVECSQIANSIMRFFSANRELGE